MNPINPLNPGSKIYVAGHRGMVGSAVVRTLQSQGYGRIIMRSSQEVDLTQQSLVDAFFERERPEAVVLAAARVGGILANSTYPTEFLYENLMIAANTIHAAAKFGVERFLFLGSSCIFPKLAPQPILESALLTGPLEETNEAYAIAKIAGLKLAEYYHREHGKAYFSVMPSNLYGTGDNYHPDHSHVIPGLIRRFHEAKVGNAKTVKVWGTGAPLREFLYVDDLAEACVRLLKNPPQSTLINVGSGEEVSILELAHLVSKAVGFTGEIQFDASKPDGTPRKIMNSDQMRALGWSPIVGLEQGLKIAYESFLKAL